MIRFLLSAFLLVSLDAHGYVRSRTPKGKAIRWPGGCVFLQPDSAGTKDIEATQLFGLVQESLRVWNDGIASCSYLKLQYDTPAVGEAHYDGVNVLKFRTDRWCHPNDDQNKENCYAKEAAAITTVFYVDKAGDDADGRILDADIEMNNINFTFVDVGGAGNQSAKDGTQRADLRNTLVHELGHYMGLDHTCRDSSTPAQAIDETGAPPPSCNAIPLTSRPKITDATMYNTALPGETKKRDPSADDIAGICAGDASNFAYPLASDPKVCDHGSPVTMGGGCSLAQAPDAGGRPVQYVAWLALALFYGLMRRKIQRGRASPFAGQLASQETGSAGPTR